MTPTHKKLCKILQSSIIAFKRPSLNEQLVFDELIWFRYDVTQIFDSLIIEVKLINTYVPFVNLPIFLLTHFCIYFRKLNTAYNL